MTVPQHSADLLLKLYDLRREPELRAAREWFAMRFHPATGEEAFAVWVGPDGARYRMVTSYWEMAASFVAFGAIDAAMFHAANTEHVAVIAKLGPFLPELRARSGLPAYLRHLESVVMAMPDAETHLAALRRYMRRRATEMRPEG